MKPPLHARSSRLLFLELTPRTTRHLVLLFIVAVHLGVFLDSALRWGHGAGFERQTFWAACGILLVLSAWIGWKATLRFPRSWWTTASFSAVGIGVAFVVSLAWLSSGEPQIALRGWPFFLGTFAIVYLGLGSLSLLSRFRPLHWARVLRWGMLCLVSFLLAPARLVSLKE